MKRLVRACLGIAVLVSSPAAAQEWRSPDPVLRAIHEEGTERSQLEQMAQALLDSVGPRLTGTPGQAAAHRWATDELARWGIAAENEVYGTWIGWTRGTAHVDLLEPRVRTLDARLLAYSRGTGGPVTAPVVVLPEAADSAAFRKWVETTRGAFVLVSRPPVTCRPVENWQQWADTATLADLARRSAAAETAWEGRLRAAGVPAWALPDLLARAGAAGILTNGWTGGWGAERVHAASTPDIPMLDVGCEDYGLLARMAERGQGPVIRVDADARLTGPAPAMNTIARIPGRALPDEYVVLSAHFDSWDAASGATDNGTGALVMMEAARILASLDRRPRRTILVGLWGGEEQGLNGSRAFSEDHPDVVAGLQALLNQDTGTGRIERISLQGFTDVGPVVRGWLARLPPALAEGVELDDPGLPSAGSSDHSSFVCRGAPAFWLLSRSWDYGTYTWHTTLDTYDKVVFPELRRNAVMIAMLAWMAAEAPERLPRTRRTEFPVDARTGRPGAWPACGAATREVR